MNLVIEKATTNHKKYFRSFENLYFETFPKKERRSIYSIYRSVSNNTNSNIYFALNLETDEFLGFLITYTLSEFVFCEYFALDKKQRGKGLGGSIMEKITKQANTPIVLEVELPDTEINKKRISFYESKGFKFWDIEYAQPSYGSGREVPLKLMTYGNINDILEIKDIIYKKIYNI